MNFKLTELEKEVCKKYKVSKKKIKLKILLKILTLISLEYPEIRIYNTEYDNCNYSILIDLNPYEAKEVPTKQGCGWTIEEALLSVLLKIEEDSFLYTDIRWELMSVAEKIKHVLT